VDGSDIVHVAWVSDELYHVWRDAGGNWSSPQDISTWVNPGPPRWAVDADNALHTVWTCATVICYARRGSDGAWSTPEAITIGYGPSGWPDLSVTGDGVAHVVWHSRTTGNEEIYYAQRRPDGSWSWMENVSDNASNSEYVRIAADSSGILHAIWRDGTREKEDVYYAWRGSDGSWAQTQNLSDNADQSYSYEVAVDGEDRPHVVWSAGVGDRKGIYYRSPPPAELVGGSILQQSVTLPAAMSHPTLSLFYQFGTVTPSGFASFAVEIEDGAGSHSILSTTTVADTWQHRWFDLSSWAGQTVTLRMQVHQAPGSPRAWAYVDEVSVSSVYPDLWVTKLARPQVARPGAQVVYGIAYGNRGSVAAQGVSISDSLPPGAVYVGAEPAPDEVGPTLVWDVGDLSATSGPATIVLTTTLPSSAAGFETYTNTVRIEASTPEQETWNNQAQAATWIGEKNYLPLLMTTE
jgi:uncharacterized repeat protein (TIGR01451 family)